MDWWLLENLLMITPVSAKPVIFCYPNNVLLVAGERVIFHVKTRLDACTVKYLFPFPTSDACHV
jgi:hypothetical protein